MSWRNPYKESRHAVHAEVNHERVQRQKEEREFIKGIKSAHRLDHIQQIRQKIKEDEQQKFLQLRDAKLAASRAAEQQDDVSAQETALPHIRVLTTVPGAVRCVEPTQGGATLWTAEEDGSIGIRNGHSGDLVFSIEATEGIHVDALLASGNLMWAGFSDGSIRIYDQVVYILAFEASRHSQGVTAFAETFDVRMFSASLDGSVVKWDSETREFALIGEVRDSSHAARALACYGYNLFVGFDSNVIRCFDAETLAPLRDFESHTASITSLATLDGFLVSASEDASVRVWDIRDGHKPVQTLEGVHAAPVTTLLVDPVGHRIWSADREGAVVVWDASPRQTITLMCQLPPTGHAICSLKGFLAFDSAKLWSLGSNGVNFVWSSNRNGVDEALCRTIANMDHIIEQDQKELARWNELIRTLLAVAERLRQTTSRKLCDSNHRLTVQHAWGAWHSWALKSLHLRQKRQFSVAVERRTNDAVSAVYLNKWRQFLASRQHRRQGVVAANAMEADANGVAFLHEFRKLRAFYEGMRRLDVRRNLAAALERNTLNRAARNFFGRWGLYRVQQILKKRRERRAEVLEQWTLSQVQRGSLQRWQKVTEKARSRGNREATAAALGAQQQRALLLVYYTKYLRFVAFCRAAKQALRQLQLLASDTDKSLIAAYYARWKRFAAERTEAARALKINETRERARALGDDVKKVQHLLKRRELVDATQAMIDAAREALERKRAQLAQIAAFNADLEANIEAKRDAARSAREKSVAEQVDDLIATLKAKVLNLHLDYALLSKITEKCKAIASTKVFLESHMAIKKIVVDLTHEVHLLPDAVWPLTMALIRRMPNHQVEAVLTAMKSLIISFDLMTPDERSSLMTDQEISLNAMWLIGIADHCVETRLKKLGAAAAFRVHK